MKITVITGSAHKHGTSSLLVDSFIRGAGEAGHKVFRFDAAQKQVSPCLGCDTCQTKGKGCVWKDDMRELNPRLLEADVIVFASPIYYYNLTAQIKAVIDRFYANNAALQGNKKAIMMLTMADNSEETAQVALSWFDHMVNFMRWEKAGVIVGINCWTRDDCKKTDFPIQAYNLGRNL